MVLKRLSWNPSSAAGQANISLLKQLQSEGMADEDIANRFNTKVSNIYNARARLVKLDLIEPRDTHVDDVRRKNSFARKRTEKHEDIGTRTKRLFGYTKDEATAGIFDLSDDDLRRYRDHPTQFFEECVYWNGSLVKLDENQREWVDDKGKFRISNKSTRIGITFTNCLEAFHDALFYPGSVNLFVSTTEDRAKEQLETIYNFVDENRDLFEGVLIGRPSTLATWTNGSKTYSLPNSAKGVRGIPQKGGITSRIDEFGHYLGDDDIKMYAAMVRNLSLGSGRLSIWSTPFGKRGLFYDIWRNKDRMYPDYKRHSLNWRKCPRMTKERIENIKKNMHPVMARQEFENEFVSTGTELFPLKLINDCQVANILMPRAEGTNTYYIGIDPAMGGGDYTGIFVTEFIPGKDADEQSRYIVRYLEKFDTSSLKMLGSKVLGLVERYNPTIMKVDETGLGRPLVRYLQEDCNLEWLVEGYVFTNPKKDDMIMRLWSLFNDGRIEIPKNDELLVELNGLQTAQTSGGLNKYEHVRGQHDDLVWSLALACYEEETAWNGQYYLGLENSDGEM